MDGEIIAHTVTGGKPGSVDVRRLSIEIPEPGQRWPRTMSEVIESRMRTGGQPLEDAWFGGSFVCPSVAVSGYLAARGAGVLAFRHAGLWHLIPFYCGTLPATPLGSCFTFSSRRPEVLSLGDRAKLDVALIHESYFLPRRPGGRWAERTERLDRRREYARELGQWGRKDFADAWITPLDHDPDGSTSGMPF